MATQISTQSTAKVGEDGTSTGRWTQAEESAFTKAFSHAAMAREASCVGAKSAQLYDFSRAAAEWLWEIDARACVTSLSGRFTAILGRLPSEFLGQPLETVGQFRAGADGAMPFAIAQRAKAAFRSQPFTIKDAEGKEHFFRLHGVPVFDETGELAGYRGVAVSEAATPPSRDETAMGEARDQRHLFLANVSHELRTPLNAIIGFAETMRMQTFGTLNERYRGYCDDILGAGRHLLSLIDDMLDASDLERDAIAMSAEPIGLADVLSEARALIEAQAAKTAVSLQGVAVDPALQVMADRRRVKQILVNLLSNAVKFTPAGGRVGVEIARIENGAARIAITVWDTGIGIPADQQSRIFECFEQTGGDIYARPTRGIGLGLHIARELARRMGGDLTVVSSPGKGSRFTFTLPAA